MYLFFIGSCTNIMKFISATSSTIDIIIDNSVLPIIKYGIR